MMQANYEPHAASLLLRLPCLPEMHHQQPCCPCCEAAHGLTGLEDSSVARVTAQETAPVEYLACMLHPAYWQGTSCWQKGEKNAAALANTVLRDDA